MNRKAIHGGSRKQREEHEESTNDARAIWIRDGFVRPNCAGDLGRRLIDEANVKGEKVHGIAKRQMNRKERRKRSAKEVM